MIKEQYSDSQTGDFKTGIFSSFVLSAFVAVICVAIVLFVPSTVQEEGTIYADGFEDAVPNSAALEIAYTASFLTDNYNSTDFAPGINPFYIQDFLNMTNPNVGDKGLQYYRNPKSRGAVEWFYIRITGRRDIAMSILNAADRENIPLTLAFALAYTESRYNPRARNTNVNGTIDRGLFQLNSRTFPQLNEDDFFSPEVSARYGLRHLRYCIGVAKDDLLAVAMYNAGVTRVKANQTPKSTLTYVSNISRYRSILDVEFDKEVVSLFDERSELLR